MIKIKNRCCYTVMLILCGTLFLTGLTGCKSREAQFLIDGLQEAKAEVDAESSEEKTSGQKSKKDTDEKKADSCTQPVDTQRLVCFVTSVLKTGFILCA